MSGQQRYLEEFEKYKDIVLEPGEYFVKGNISLKYRILEISDTLVVLERNNFISKKTPHWCRKHLQKL